LTFTRREEQDMLTTSASIALGLAFVLIGGLNVWLMFESMSRLRSAQASSRMLALHRAGGYLFIALFCVMGSVMIARLRDGAGEASPTVTVHLALAMVLSPLLFLKVLIARYYKSQHGLLMPIGLTIFVLAFALVASAVAPHLARAPGVGAGWKSIAVVSLVCLAVIPLALRRPGRGSAAVPAAQVAPAAAPRPTGGPFLLRLVRITPQTPDARTLRFTVPGRQTIDARPGQFLTFSFLFDGKKETRCYSICSSPTRAGYVEITPKRVANGRVSVFLNDRAEVGMTVEAAGPFGHFCLDATNDRSIVLLAAGSGITPMMAMLRYIDDLGLDTEVTLLYCVRTSKDIIFRDELEDLRSRVKHFRLHVLLSQPDPEWSGARGRISREFVRNAVPEVGGRVFFLCGPPPFMEAAREILTALGARPEAIRQESFGGRGGEVQPFAGEGGFSVEFARSGRAGTIRHGETLLQAAAANGVEIPSACRQGQCGTCKTRVLDGRVRMAADHGLDPESRARGYVLTCVARADGDVKLDA
jgi:ferredoxin-NADP reductase